MKKIVLLLLVVVIMLPMVSCSDPDEKERPDDIIATAVRVETLQTIETMFSKDISAKTNLPALFEPTTEKRILLAKESEVYVTFISEGASYQNSFGYYTYNSSAPPADVSALKLTMLFPNVSDVILKKGDMLQVGITKFPAGTVIGFFIIINGWESGSVHYDRDKIYTDMSFNAGGEQQHVLFKLKDFGDIILGFEDIQIAGTGNRINDFNDLLFTVTDNRENREVTNFKLDKVVVL